MPGNSTSRDAEDAQVYSSTTLQLNKSCLCITALLRGVPGEPQAKGDHVTVQRSKLVAWAPHLVKTCVKEEKGYGEASDLAPHPPG